MSVTLIWVSLALLATAGGAAMTLAAEYYKAPTVARLFWVRIFSFAAAVPFAFFIDWPDARLFYVCAVSIACLACASDILYFTAARDHGAGPTSRIEPLSVLLTFILWTALMPSQLQAYLAQPLVATGICACLVFAFYCAMHLRHSAIALATLKKLIPVAVIMAVINLLAKTGMDAGGHPFDAVMAYLIILAGILSAVYGAGSYFWPQRCGSMRPQRALLKGSALIAAASIVLIVPKNMAYVFVSNPAYVNVIGLCAPVLVFAFYKLAGRRDEAAVWAGFGIVASAAILVVLTTM